LIVSTRIMFSVWMIRGPFAVPTGVCASDGFTRGRILGGVR
jgi:hypothetical protein